MARHLATILNEGAELRSAAVGTTATTDSDHNQPIFPNLASGFIPTNVDRRPGPPIRSNTLQVSRTPAVFGRF
jgi:hypothetical protein